MYKVDDIVNGYKILELESGKKNGYYYYNYRVKCIKCGDEKIVGRGNINNQGCSKGPCHFKFIDLTDKRFGSLIALEYVKVKDKWKWKCECDCGNICYVRSTQLTKHQQSCRKCGFKRMAIKNKLPSNESSINRIIKQYKTGAKSRGLKFSLTKENVKEIIFQDCHYCGNQPRKDNLGIERNGIDRIDSSKNYTLDNVVSCCSICNMAKSNMSEKEFYSWIYQLYHRQDAKGTFNDYPEREYTQVSGNGEALNRQC